MEKEESLSEAPVSFKSPGKLHADFRAAIDKNNEVYPIDKVTATKLFLQTMQDVIKKVAKNQNLGK